MNLKEATQLLQKSGYTVIKERIMTINDFDITCEYEGTSDYEPGDGLPSPYVIVTPLTPGGYNFLKAQFVNKKDQIIETTSITDIIDDGDFVEFVFPETDFCDNEMRDDYENTVKNLINNVLTRR